MDKQQVPHLDLGKRAVRSEAVRVLAEHADDVVATACRRILLAHDRDMVVGAVEHGAHEVGRACVNAQVVVVGLLAVDDTGHKRTERRQHVAAELRGNADVSHANGNQTLLVHLANELANEGDVVLPLVRLVGDAHAAREVHETHVDSQLALEGYGRRKQCAGQRRIVAIRDGV